MTTTQSHLNSGEPASIVVEYGVSMVLEDGTTLVADLYYPPGNGPVPVLLMRQPYGRAIASTVVYAQPESFARQGFLVVIQDVRGRGDSAGVFYPFRGEASDGLATLQWARTLPRADGRVCMYGFSYQGYTQLALLEAKPEGLVAIAPHMSAADLHSGWFYPYDGNIQLATALGWGNQMLREDAWRAGQTELAQRLERSWLQPGSLNTSLPIHAVMPLTEETAAPYVKDWLRHPEYDDYWEALDCSASLAASETPVFHLTGYYDFYAAGSCAAYALRRDKLRDWFVLGPWKHLPWEQWNHGFDFGCHARMDTDSALVRWLQAQLDPGDEGRRGVTYFLVGANRWQDASSWPPPTVVETRCYLRSAGSANSCFGDGSLSLESAGGPADTFVYDPQVPVAAPGGNPPVWGPCDLVPQQQGNNLLVYDLFPGRSLTFAGEAELDLYVQSTAPETDFVARLSWLRRDRSARFLTLAVTSLSKGEAAAGESVRLRLRFGPFALALDSDEGLRLDIASSAFPLLPRNPNTGGHPLAVESVADFRIARQTLFHDANRPSCLLLPELP
jgi:uncharacterized protein